MGNLSPLFADISSNNSEFDAQAYRDAGHLVVAIKATQDTVYVNPDHRAWCYQAGAKHISIVHYHFATPDTGTTAEEEARHFLSVVLPLAGGRDFLALDLERAVRAGWAHDPAWSKAFDSYVQEMSRFHTILYGSRATLQINDDAGAWLAGDLLRFWDADWSTDRDFAPKGGVAAIRQQSGVTSGVPPFALPGVGPCDVDVARGAFWQQILLNSKR